MLYKFRCESHAGVTELKKALGNKMSNVKVVAELVAECGLFGVSIPDDIITFESDIPLKQLRQLFGKVNTHVAEILQSVEEDEDEEITKLTIDFNKLSL